MTALGPALLDLSTKGHRRQGMNRQNKYTSLHGDRIKNAGKASDGSKSPAEKLEEEDVYALPKDSSSDNNADVAESDGPGRVKTSQRKSMLNGKGKSFTKPAVISYPGGRPPEPQMNAGNRSDGEENGDEEPARSKKKRKLEDLRDEDMMGLFAPSQPQNSKRGYGLVKNIHTSTYGKKGARRGVNAKDGKSQKQDERNGFKTLDTGTLLTDAKPKFRVPPASTAKDSQDRSVPTSESEKEKPQFKSLNGPSPKKSVPSKKLRLAPGRGTANPRNRQTRSRQAKSKPQFANPNLRNRQNLVDLVSEAGRKLDIPELAAAKGPSSSVYTCSPFEGQWSPKSSSLSSPPTSPEEEIVKETNCTPKRRSKHGVIEISSSSPGKSILGSFTCDETSRQPACPLCKAPVDRLFLESYASSTNRLTIREQASFCKAHTLHSAREEWHSNKYPDIDWSTLNDRVTAHHSVIQELLGSKRPSFFRNAYEDFLQRGNRQHRTLQQSLVEGGDLEEDLAPGYYGSKGARIMIDNLMTRFAPTLRRRPPKDHHLISQGGVHGYVAAVLVPEMATRLVMQDLRVGEEEARSVLRESRHLGTVLCEEEEDEGIDDVGEEGDIEAIEG